METVQPSEFNSEARLSLVTRIRQQPLAVLGVALLALFVASALFAPWLAPQDPAQLRALARLMLGSNATSDQLLAALSDRFERIRAIYQEYLPPPASVGADGGASPGAEPPLPHSPVR